MEIEISNEVEISNKVDISNQNVRETQPSGLRVGEQLKQDVEEVVLHIGYECHVITWS